MLDKTKANNPRNGYDILSFDFEGNPLYIEVKGTKEKEHKTFFISAHEMNIMKKYTKAGKQYLIYSVTNILDISGDIKIEIIDDIYNSEYTLKIASWKAQRMKVADK